MKSRQLQFLLGLSSILAPLSISCVTQVPATAAPAIQKPRFESDILEFEAADRKSFPPTGAVLVTGSSTARMWTTLAQDFPELTVINRGFGGSHMSDNVRFTDRIVLPYKPKMVIVYAGTNDIADGKEPVEVFNDFKNYVWKIRRDLPQTRIVYLSINPSSSRWAKEPKFLETNRLIANYVRENDGKLGPLGFLDSHTPLLGRDGKPRTELMISDGLHLNAQGYAELTAIVRPQILKWAAEPTKP